MFRLLGRRPLKQEWLFVCAASIPSLLLGISVAISSGGEKPDGGEVKKVQQGLGYWEKADSNADYRKRLSRIRPRDPEASLKSFHILPGLEIEHVACEPMVADVVDMCFDENGRMYVCELMSYAENPPRDRGRVLRLEDADNDGTIDKRTVFADELSWPTSALPFDGGIFLTCAPDVFYLKDIDGDGKADLREVIISGFLTTNTATLPNSLRWGLDDRIHGMSSSAGGAIRSVKWNQSDPGHDADPVEIRGRDFSLHPRTGELRLESGGSQHGMTYDRWGRKFECSNSAPIEMVMCDNRYIARNPYLAVPSARIGIWKTGSKAYRTSPAEPWRLLRTEMRQKGTFAGSGRDPASGYFTAACGVTIYEGDALRPARAALGPVGRDRRRGDQPQPARPGADPISPFAPGGDDPPAGCAALERR
ncbi:MAG: PVC-type heme-binding CxxCH protein [Planctomycetota bacterium]